MEEIRICISCHRVLGENSFHWADKKKGVRRNNCKRCKSNKAKLYDEDNRDKINKRNKQYYKNNKKTLIKSVRKYIMKSKFNITIEQYDLMLEEQDNSCAICGKSPEENGRRLSVDHNHITGEVRGLLCSNCNFGIGLFQDDITLLRSAINYLKE